MFFFIICFYVFFLVLLLFFGVVGSKFFFRVTSFIFVLLLLIRGSGLILRLGCGLDGLLQFLYLEISDCRRLLFFFLFRFCVFFREFDLFRFFLFVDFGVVLFKFWVMCWLFFDLRVCIILFLFLILFFDCLSWFFNVVIVCFFFLIFFILLFVGIFVNVYVLYVFGIKIKWFIYCVFVLGFGCIDMFGCIVFIFFQIIDEIYFYIFFDVIFCKIFRFFDINLVIVVVLMFVVIVFERFWKICCLNGL